LLMPLLLLRLVPLRHCPELVERWLSGGCAGTPRGHCANHAADRLRLQDMPARTPASVAFYS